MAAHRGRAYYCHAGAVTTMVALVFLRLGDGARREIRDGEARAAATWSG